MSAMRRNSSYSWKQREHLTMWAAGMSCSLRRRSRYAIARKVELFGQPTRLGFGKPAPAYFLPRAITSLTNVEDAERLDSVIGFIRCSLHSFARLWLQT